MVGKMRDLCYLTDENLVKMFKDGNEWCFNEIYNRYYNRLYGYAVKYLLSREDAEEVVNTALFKAFKYLHKFRGEASLATWLFQILRNQTFSLYRLKRSKGVFVTQSLEVITSDNTSFIMEITDYKSLPENFLINQEITYKVKDRELLYSRDDLLQTGCITSSRAPCEACGIYFHNAG